MREEPRLKVVKPVGPAAPGDGSPAQPPRLHPPSGTKSVGADESPGLAAGRAGSLLEELQGLVVLVHELMDECESLRRSNAQLEAKAHELVRWTE